MTGERLVVFDVETSGLDEAAHDIIQFAAIAVDAEWHELEALELKVDFDLEAADPRALAINGYDAEVWRRLSLRPPVARAAIAEFLRRHATFEKVSKSSGKPYTVARVCGHNAASFDGRFLAAWFKRADQFLPALARWASFVTPPGPKNHQLGSLCEWLGIEHGGPHEALADVRATVEVARRLAAAMRPLQVATV